MNIKSEIFEIINSKKFQRLNFFFNEDPCLLNKEEATELTVAHAIMRKLAKDLRLEDVVILSKGKTYAVVVDYYEGMCSEDYHGSSEAIVVASSVDEVKEYFVQSAPSYCFCDFTIVKL